MSNKNDNPVIFTEEQKELIKNSIDTLSENLLPFLHALTPAQRLSIPKMGESSVVFVHKTLDYALSNPEFVAKFMNVESLANNITTVYELTDIYRSLDQLVKLLDDTIMMAGSDAYKSSLQYYNSVKMGVRMNAPGAKTIVADLSKRFERNTGKKEGEGD